MSTRNAKAHAPLGVEPLESRLALSVAAVYDGTTLRVGGDNYANDIRIDQYLGSEAVMIRADGRYIPLTASGGTVVAPQRIEIYCWGGNDTVTTSGIPQYRGSIAVYGGLGNDYLSLASAYVTRYSSLALYGEVGNDILVGGDGNDLLYGDGPSGVTGGRDVIVGGRGADTLYGDGNEDLLIAGYTNYDSRVADLRAVGAWWCRTDKTYTERAQGLLYNWNGYAGPKLDDSTVHTDGVRDTMYGGTGTDYFYTDPNQDVVGDLSGGEWRAWIWR